MNHEIISEKQYEKSFEELYGAKIAQVYDQEIVEFFIGKNYYSTDDPYWEQEDGVLVHKGNIWVATHYDVHDHQKKVCATLTVEPLDGNQFEIAVRVALVDDRCTSLISVKNGKVVVSGDAKYSGYRINEFGTMTGVCTSGH